MNEQMTRLYAAAKKLCDVEGQTNVARLLNASPQTVANWESRPISYEGLLKAQEMIGCDAIWLRDGTGEMVRGGTPIAPDLSDVAQLITLYGQLDDKERLLVLDFVRDGLRRGTIQGETFPAQNNS